MPRSLVALTTYRLTFRNSGADYFGEGPTAASHDSPSAMGWCRMRLIFDHVGGGWTYYKAAGRARFAGEGGSGVPCQDAPLKFGRLALRARQAGAKLKAQFGWLQIPSSFDRDRATYLSRTS
jgi:hypothetical protein